MARKRKAAATDLERFVGADGRADLVKEVRQRIDAEGITYIYYQFPSVTGRIMLSSKGAAAVTGGGFVEAENIGSLRTGSKCLLAS